MNIPKAKLNSRNGFTIVELIIVITVIGILATISIVSYGAWRHSVISAKVKSDLNGVVTAMESSRTFNNVYSASIPSTFIPSSGVVLSGGSTNGGKTYCADASDTSDDTISYFITPLTKTVGPLPGACSTYNSLSGWWLLNGDPNDSSPGGSDGTVNGATITSGAIGTAYGAYAFSGSAQYITFPAVHNTTTGSVSLWFQSNSAQPSSPGGWFILSAPQSADNSRLYIETNSTGNAIIAVLGNVTIGTATIDIVSWHNVIVTWSGTSDKLYIDGVDKTVNGTFNGLTSTGANMYLGCLSSSATQCTKGKIDDVRVYNRALTASEVQGIYSVGALW